MKIRKGDKVKVVSGKDKGREGVVSRVYPKQSKVLLPEINIYKKHIKKTDQTPQGGVVEVPRAMDVSKIGLICPSCKKITRVGYKQEENSKVRICRKCGKKI